ncbi:hypothetical protein DFH08DRAFT_968535 [Mycena albidolilacea]|uniref:Uncharacterized protein n=1 Tax=Mycena albidolilacea TaxID=1033008 RepID=A0AAD6ZJQ2_9AGAR|nr:hypothetical protein DFH08DRAFT_968535 [Mycena albidolilacea]
MDPRTWATTAGAAVAAAATVASGAGHGQLAGGQPGQGSRVQVDDGWRGRVCQKQTTMGNGWSGDRFYQPTIMDMFDSAGVGEREEAPHNGEGMDIADREPGLSLDEQAAIRAVNEAHHRARDLLSQQSQTQAQTQTQGPAVPVGGAP